MELQHDGGVKIPHASRFDKCLRNRNVLGSSIPTVFEQEAPNVSVSPDDGGSRAGGTC